MCFDHDGDYPEFSRTDSVTARKPHKCSACRGVIPPGAEYERHVGKYAGAICTFRLCRRCCYDRNRIVEHELAEGCRWDESWPADQEIVDYLLESEMGQTRPEDVPATFKIGDMPAIPAGHPQAGR